VPIVAPTGAGKLLQGWGHSHVREVDAGDELGLGGLVVRATRAEHESSRGPFSERSASLGYVVQGSASVYFAGDTDLFDEMAEFGPVDVAVLPVSGWGPKLPAGHLDPRGAAQALRLLRPRIAVPVHWGTFRTPFAPRPDDRPAQEFVRAAAELAPEVDVRVLAIGETLALEAAQ
jgi:L-ascorbate metabolism protein UlaG (beta-lactamase superfamily)